MDSKNERKARSKANAELHTVDLAFKINNHLADNGVVQVSTRWHSMLYTQKHVGWFYTGKDGNLHVKSGRTSNQLSIGNMPMVGIRYGRYSK